MWVSPVCLEETQVELYIAGARWQGHPVAAVLGCWRLTTGSCSPAISFSGFLNKIHEITANLLVPRERRCLSRMMILAGVVLDCVAWLVTGVTLEES